MLHQPLPLIQIFMIVTIVGDTTVLFKAGQNAHFYPIRNFI